MRTIIAASQQARIPTPRRPWLDDLATTVDLRGGTTTDGGRENGQGEVGVLRIRGDNRLTLNVKYSRADNLLESERGINAAAPSMPYSLAGNITAIDRGAEIDPALSAAAGQTVTVAVT